MKYLSFILLFLAGAALFTSCDNEDFPRPSCEILADEILERIRANTPVLVNTQIEFRNQAIVDNGVPGFDGCIARFSGVSFNLDQLISYEVVNNTTLIMRFP